MLVFYLLCILFLIKSWQKKIECVSHFVGEEIDSITQEINSKVGFQSKLD